MDKPIMLAYGMIERYIMILPDGVELIIDACSPEEGEPYIEIRKKGNYEIINDLPIEYQAYAKRFIFENGCFFE